MEAGPATAPESVRLDDVVVVGTRGRSITGTTAEDSRAELRKVPGASTVIGQDQIRDHVQQNVEDVLDASPGVYAESFSSTTPEALISIRGSGVLQAGAIISGVRLLQDGIPIVRTPFGYASVEVIDQVNLSHVAVHRGAQALEYGAASLGGAINFLTPTGYTAERLRVGLIGGSFDSYRPYISSGGVLEGGVDYFVSASGIYSQGFRTGNDDTTKTPYLSANIGNRWDERQETRLYFNYSKNHVGIPGALTKPGLEADPRQIQAPGAVDSDLRAPYKRFAVKHTLQLREQDQIELAAWYQDQNGYGFENPPPGTIAPGRAPGSPFTSPFIFREDISDFGFSLRDEVHVPVLGRDNRLVWGVLYTKGTERSTSSFNGNGVVNARDGLAGENLEFFIHDEVPLTDRVSLVPGVQLARAIRRELSFFPASSRNEKKYYGFSPKIGVVWKAIDSAQIFGNASRSFEPPIAGFGANFTSTDPDGNTILLNAQRATTFELGARGVTEYLGWEVAVYHALVKDELITDQRDENNPASFFNSNGDTTHSGVELGLNAKWPLNLLAAGDKLSPRLNYTYNRFRFDGGNLDGNSLPLLPDHVANVELLYEHPSGFYIGPNLDIKSRAFVDFSNSQSADAYTLLGARIGYKSRAGYSIFVQGENLTDEAYAATVRATANINNSQASRRYLPGPTRSVFAGIEFRLP